MKQSFLQSLAQVFSASLARGSWYALAVALLSLNGLVSPEIHAQATVPGAPTGVSATAGDASASVSFSPPSSDGGAPITSYRGTCGPSSTTGAVSPITVGSLTNGNSYTCTVAAYNSVGWGPESSPSGSVAPLAPTAPTEPQNVVGTRGDAQISVAFDPPSNSGTVGGGGAASITGYTATCGSQNNTGATPIIVSGLTNGTSYSCTVTATNSASLTGPVGTAAAVTPATVPGQPSNVAAVGGNANASVSFDAPASDGGAAVDNYRATCNPGAITAEDDSSPINVTGLTNGTSYTCTVSAHNEIGWGAASAASNSVTPATVPGAPTGVSAVAGNASATVSYAAPASNGGAAIDYYLATCNPGAFGATGVGLSITVPGLSNGTAYTCKVTAHNSVGFGPDSAASGSVTPSAPTPPSAPQNVIGTPGNGEISLTFDPPSSPGTEGGTTAATITSYTATCDSQSNAGTSSPIVVTGLTNGTPYSCTVTATNSASLTGPAGTAVPVTPQAVPPDAPSGVSATPGNISAAVAFTPGGTGGAPIDRYRAICTSSNGGASATSYGTASPVINAPLTAGKDYTCTVAAHNSVDWGTASAPSSSFTVPSTTTSLPDTGQGSCYDGSTLVACSSANTGDAATYKRQDGRYGRDVAAAAGVLTKIGAGAKGFDYTPLDADGDETTPTSGATPHPCVRDNVTGLVWEVKTNDGGLHDKDHSFTWYNTTAEENGGQAGSVGNSSSCSGSGLANCNTKDYVAAVNDAGWCGRTDWRVPSRRELRSLLHLGAQSPAIDSTYFPNTASGFYWTRETYAGDIAAAWEVDFNLGYIIAFISKASSFEYLRLVSGAPF